MMVADKWSIMIVAAGLVVAASVLMLLYVSPPIPVDTHMTSGFPYCLRVLQCGNVEQFDGIPYDQILVIAKNYDSCFDDHKIEQTCNVQVQQDIERFHELGHVTRR